VLVLLALLLLAYCCCRWRELAKTKYAAWQQDSKQRTAVAATLKQQIDGLVQTCQWHAGSLPPELFSGNGSMQAGSSGLQDKQQQNMQELVQQQWGVLFDRAAHLDKPGEVPSHLLCPLTMEVSPCLPPRRLGCVWCSDLGAQHSRICISVQFPPWYHSWSPRAGLSSLC
jgi:hypothetical protein